MYEVGRGFPKHVQRTCLTGESPLGRPRVARTLHLYNYLLRFHLTVLAVFIASYNRNKRFNFIVKILWMLSLIYILSGYYPISRLSSDRIIIRLTG